MKIDFYTIVLSCCIFFCSNCIALKEAEHCSMHIQESNYDRDSFLQYATAAGPNQICSSTGEYTCCNKTLEKKLSKQNILALQRNIQVANARVSEAFTRMRKRFDDHFLGLINDSRASLHHMFKDTYGNQYSDNSAVFMTMFEELEVYYKEPSHDVARVWDTFFTSVMQRMFKIIHSNRNVTDNYLSCVADNMDTVQPFGDVPAKLSAQIQRSFAVARSIVRGLDVAKSVEINEFHPGEQCEADLLRMTSCWACRGQPSHRPCRSHCLRVVGGCLAGFPRLHQTWGRFTDAMQSLLLQLEGANNVEAVLQPLDVKISDAVMTLQRSRAQVSNMMLRRTNDFIDLVFKDAIAEALLMVVLMIIQQCLSRQVFGFCGTPPLKPDATPDPSNEMESILLDNPDEIFLEPDLDYFKRNKRSIKHKGNHRSSNRKPGHQRKEKRRKKLKDDILLHPRLSGPRSGYRGATPSVGSLALLSEEMREVLIKLEDIWASVGGVWCDGKSGDGDTCWKEDDIILDLLPRQENVTHQKSDLNMTSVQTHVHNLRNLIGQLDVKYVQQDNDDEDNGGFDYSGDGSGEGSAQIDTKQFKKTPTSATCETCDSYAIRSNSYLIVVLLTLCYYLKST